MERDSITSFENLCKIFAMRIKLDREKKVNTPVDVLNNYEKYSKKIDNYYNEEFQNDLKPLLHPAQTLEKEEERLKKLIKLLEERVAKRDELEEHFYNATGKYITGLQTIISDDELDDKKRRLSLVSKYLETSNEINNIEDSISKLKNLLSDEEAKKEEYTAKNKIMEDEAYSTFVENIQNDAYFKDINEDEINAETDKVKAKVDETKETLDITKESISSLITNGLEDDYTSYIEEAERNYFIYKNRELLLGIYSLVINFEEDFKLLYAKYEKINDLLNERKTLRENLNIEDIDILMPFEKVILNTLKTLGEEKEVLENIFSYDSRIKFKEEREEELNEINNSVEILAILREYGLIDTYDTEDVEDSSFEEIPSDDINLSIKDETLETTDNEEVVKEVYDPYHIVMVKDYPKTLNVGLAKLKGESVREKVNKKLNPKKEEMSFIDINSSKEEKVSDKEETPKSENGDSDKLPDNNINYNMPPLVWELPKTEEISKEEPKQDFLASLPVWNIDLQKDANKSNDVNSFPDKPLEMANLSLPVNGKPLDDNTVDNMFWIPVSDSKIDSSAFPSINIPINNSGNNNFPPIN